MWKLDTQSLRPSLDFEVLPGSVDPSGALRARELLRLMQDLCDITLAAQSDGTWWMKSPDLGWMTRSYHLRLTRPLMRGETLRLVTWFAPYKDLLSLRRFVIYRGDEQVGRCDSSWMLVRLSNRRVARLSRNLTQGYMAHSLPVEEPRLAEELPLTAPEKNGTELLLPLRRDDFDGNGHVNNTVYAALMSQGIPDDGTLAPVGLDLVYEHELKNGPARLRSLPVGDHTFEHQLFDAANRRCAWGRTLWHRCSQS